MEEIERLLRNGISYYREKNYDLAAAEFQEILREYPQFYEASLFLGKCREEQHKNGESIRAYELFLRNGSKDIDRMSFLADICREEKEYGYAALMYGEVLKERPTFENYYLAGYCNYYGKNYGQAALCLTKALQLKSDDYSSLLLLAESYRNLRQFTKALGAYKSALAQKPREIFILYEMGAVCYEMGDFKNAESYLKEYNSRESNPERKNKGKDLLRAVSRSNLKRIPSHVEQQDDTITGMELKAITKRGDAYAALIRIDRYEAEYTMGQTIQSKYYVLDINEYRVVLKFCQNYYVLRPKEDH